MLKLGITGGIGCGKSEVCRQLALAEIPIIHADQVAKDFINNNKEVKAKIQKQFGEDVYFADGNLNKKLLTNIIFNNKKSREQLNNIVHPYVLNFQKEELQRLELSGKYQAAGVEAALIFEANSQHQFDVIIVISATIEAVIKRLQLRDNISECEIMKRIESQLPLHEKIKRADYIVQNNGPLDELNHKVKRLLISINNHER